MRFKEYIYNENHSTAQWQMLIDTFDKDDKNNPHVLYRLVKNDGTVLWETDSAPNKRGNKEFENEYNVVINKEILKIFTRQGE